MSKLPVIETPLQKTRWYPSPVPDVSIAPQKSLERSPPTVNGSRRPDCDFLPGYKDLSCLHFGIIGGDLSRSEVGKDETNRTALSLSRRISPS